MNCRNAALAVLLAVMLSFGFVASDGSDAADLGFGDGSIAIHDFDDMGKGSITVYLDNTSDKPMDVTVKVLDRDSREVIGSTAATLPAKVGDDESTLNHPVDVSFGYNSTGYKYFDVQVFIGEKAAPEITQTGLSVNVGHNIWKDSMTYILIIGIIIVIAVIAYLYMRNAPKRKAKKMTDTTFTELEAQRRQKKSERKASGPSKYEGKKRN